jgi:hypothetical protein
MDVDVVLSCAMFWLAATILVLGLLAGTGDDE